MGLLLLLRSRLGPSSRLLGPCTSRVGVQGPSCCLLLSPCTSSLGVQDRLVLQRCSSSSIKPLDYYSVMGVLPSATQEEIKKAFKDQVVTAPGLL